MKAITKNKEVIKNFIEAIHAYYSTCEVDGDVTETTDYICFSGPCIGDGRGIIYKNRCYEYTTGSGLGWYWTDGNTLIFEGRRRSFRDGCGSLSWWASEEGFDKWTIVHSSIEEDIGKNADEIMY
jgi:hypothetical protein